MKILTDVMIDLETLATTPNATVLTVGAVRFNRYDDELSTPEFLSMYARVDIDSCEVLELDISDDTLAWWAKQSEAAREEAFSSGDRTDIGTVLDMLADFCKGAKSIWSHGANFDSVVCENLYRKMDKPIPWQYYNVRCSRTLFDLGINPDRPQVTAHNALEDAYHQACSVQKVFRALRDCGIAPK
jgi:hypothetical protein